MSGVGDEGAATSAQVATALFTALQAHARTVRESRRGLELMAADPRGREQLAAQLAELRHWLAIMQPACREISSASEAIAKALRKGGKGLRA